MLALGVTVVLWASAFVGIRAITDSFSPGAMALGRLSCGAVVMTVIAWPRRTPLPTGRTLGLVIVYGLAWFAAYNVALNAGEVRIDAGTAALLVNIGPLLIALVAGVIFSEGFPKPLVAGILIAFAGVALIAFGGDSRSDTDLIGTGLCVLAALLYAVGVLVQKRVLRSMSALTVTWYGCLIGTVACLPFAPALFGELSTANTGDISILIYLGVFPTAIAFTTFSYALGRLNAGTTSATTYLVPPTAILISWALLSETPTQVALVGGAMCLVGVAITRVRSKVLPPDPEAGQSRSA